MILIKFDRANEISFTVSFFRHYCTINKTVGYFLLMKSHRINLFIGLGIVNFKRFM